MKKIKITDLVPLIAFVALFIIFTVASGGQMVTSYALQKLLEQSIQTIVVACGVLFVVAQGSIDLSVGVNVALSGVIGLHVAVATGIGWLMIPVTLLVGLIVGVFNGVIVAKCHVPSFTLTIAMLIGVRGIVNFIQTNIGVENIPTDMEWIKSSPVRIIAFIIVLVIVAYVFEFTRVGKYSQAIGENETTAKFIGIPVSAMKILVFAISGLLAGAGAIFSIATVGATTQTMGSFLEMKVAMAVFFGGVLVTGGTSAKFYKVILGSLSITVIVYGLSLIGMSDSHISQSIEGGLLLLIMFVTIMLERRRNISIKKKAEQLAMEESKNSAGA